MGNNESFIIKKPHIKCTYQVNDVSKTIRIINNKCGDETNNDLEAKIKILKGGKEEKLIFTMKFDNPGTKIIYFIIEGKLNNMSYMFRNCSTLKEISFVRVETDQVTNMNSMFSGCYILENADLSNFDTINVTDMNSMFHKCYNLKKINGINNFRTNNVIIMKKLFYSCLELEKLDLANFNTNNVADMGYMFAKCYKLKEIEGITNFNTSNVTSMKAMFMENAEMEVIDLSNFDTTKVNNMSFMFYKCHSLKEIKGINNFKTYNVTDMNSMFGECTVLEYLDLSNFNTINAIYTELIFDKCVSLKQIKGNNNFKQNPDEIKIKFINTAQNIECIIKGNKKDNFGQIQEKLYLEYPQLKNKNIYFLFGGDVINNKSASLEGIKLKNGSIIIFDELNI